MSKEEVTDRSGSLFVILFPVILDSDLDVSGASP
jgi:hypothetical protein